MPNQLTNETSPYLRQHADNPVNWYPWGDQALARAKAENKPIFLSIGYAACHWCHVMAHESFEDPATAAIMNDLYINIKVDREERPDLDQIYMAATIAMTGHGGWPMSVWLTPEGQPFYAGTYFPPKPRYNMPAFTQVLQAVHAAWLDRQAEVRESANKISAALDDDFLTRLMPNAPKQLTPAVVTSVPQTLWKNYDRRNGGWGTKPKFPQPMLIEVLLRLALREGNNLARDMAENTLRKMAEGGMYDQLGGGFHRYSVDELYLVPHFEKMLYDNAQLARVYLHAYQLTGNPFYKTVCEDICDYVLRDMTDKKGGFYAAEDADSEGVEGKFYVWTPAETLAILGDELGALFNAAYDITPTGNFEGHAIPRRILTDEDLAAKFDLDPDRVAYWLSVARDQLFAVRSQRVRPGLDDKIITAWNGMMLAALSEAARVLNRPDYAAAAIKNATFLLETMRAPDGRLFRTQRKDSPPKIGGFLEDYANLADGLFELYQTTFDEAYFIAARDLINTALTHFRDPAGGFFDTADDAETLFMRPKDVQDNATPSGNAVLTDLLLKLSALTGNGDYTDIALTTLCALQPAMQQMPSGFARWLQAADFTLGDRREVALVGDPTDPATQALLTVLRTAYRPYLVVALRQPTQTTSAIALLDHRTLINGQPAAYVCKNFYCELPVTTPTDLAQLLAP